MVLKVKHDVTEIPEFYNISGVVTLNIKNTVQDIYMFGNSYISKQLFSIMK